MSDISMFEPREMIPMLEEAKPARTFLQSLFFSNVHEATTEHVDIDIKVGKRRLAPIVAPRFGSKTVERTGFNTKSYTPPMVAPDMITTAEDIMNRSAGENIYGAKSPDDRAAEILTADMLEMDEMITRREEEMAAQALFKGEIALEGEGVSDVLKYWSQLDPSEQPTTALTSGSRWNESGGAIAKNLRDWRRLTSQNSGVAATDAILGTDAADALLSNEVLMKQLDTRRIDMGEIRPEILPDGVTYLGFIRGTGLDLWSYDEWYLDQDTNDELPMVPPKKVLLGSRNARTTMMYGMVVDLEYGSFANRRVPISWTQRKPQSGRVLAVKSRPLPVINQINGFYVAEVLA